MGRFVQADTVVPLQSQGTQAWDRYAYVNNNPIRFNDPSGHAADAGGADTCTDEELYEAYVALAQRTDPSSWDGWLREYYYNVAVYHLERSRGISENIEVSWAHFEHARDSLYINGYGTLDLAISTAWETAAPDTMIGAVQMVSAGAGVVGSSIVDLANDISDWVGQGSNVRTIRNKYGDFILVNDGNTRRFRFDYHRTDPHLNPHMHLEWKNQAGDWDTLRIYPSDVEPR